ncbi:MAG TPA: ATPase [Cyanobacteria bacterium UBA11149]|nr:ATPase [Cyanobacteria bacterium UBA11367]HBE58889.1 ATPase [Cyanobacteria bacterium UBA11366]HBK65426.1 ATPase [Cyanobacteria bacterium UBA11166]HBR73533.1 ATPase [Cyanobacteria bacterium UBA11159]HBS69575.1 ATPase [Cyanobacteria bacterium UBA11153]HBW92237.1 ATPase [Cyanobacteria bacterium UBA11149]HCA93983.1 ATPase [Cyanobacteria bacterium UBA9226]
MLMQKKAEFIRLFQEFVQSYPNTPAGLRRISVYNQQRQERKRNFEAIFSEFESGEEVTEAVLLQLLPYSKSANTLQSADSIDNTPGITKDIKEWFEGANWIKPEDLQKVAVSLLTFIRRCHQYPSQLSAHCQEFSALAYSMGFHTGILTPILNTLLPDCLLLVNNELLQVINYFAYTSYSQKLQDYPAINITGGKLIKELAQYMHIPGVPALRDDDLFDMFCHWLVGINKYNLFSQKLPHVDELVNPPLDIEDMNLQPEYTLAQCAKDTGIEEETLKFWLQALERKQQAIFYGPPGTGKTYIAKKLAKHLIGGGDGFMDVVQFHPAYAYEDFVQGIRPQRKNGELDYPLVDGRFVEFCHKARNCQNICVLIIDEINRANVARVFGELMYLLEYRHEEITLAAGENFSIPDNVRIIGTMNTADSSIALVDHALRRRFAFISLSPNYEILRRYHASIEFPVEGLIKILKQLNQQIGNHHYEIGISFFMRPDITQQIESIWKLEIEPYLEEYFFDQPSKVNQFRWDKVKQEVCP